VRYGIPTSVPDKLASGIPTLKTFGRSGLGEEENAQPIVWATQKKKTPHQTLKLVRRLRTVECRSEAR
jgi:hypothetical protein